ncbi:MAG TPA: Na+-dependent transporter [Methylomirabilota bacterium]
MTAAEMVWLALRTNIFLIVFSLGLRANHADVLYLLSRPGRLSRSLLAMNVIMPLVAVGLSLAFDLHPAVKTALVCLSLAPVPPILPKKELKAGGHGSYVIGLLFAAALLAIVFIPLAEHVLRILFNVGIDRPPTMVVGLVAVTVLLPLVAGILVRRLAPALAERWASPLNGFATILLALTCIVLLLSSWKTGLPLIGNGHVLVIAVFVAVGLIVGHLLGGPEPENRVVLALSTASRHPGVALAIATGTSPDEKLVIGAILLYLLVNAALSIAYIKWARQRESVAVAGVAPR